MLMAPPFKASSRVFSWPEKRSWFQSTSEFSMVQMAESLRLHVVSTSSAAGASGTPRETGAHLRNDGGASLGPSGGAVTGKEPEQAFFWRGREGNL